MILILKEPLRVNPGQATWLQWTQEGASILSVGPRGTAHPKPEMTLCPTLPIPGFPHPHQTNKKPYQVQHPLLPRAVPLASLTSQSITVCSVWSLLSVTASFALFSSHWSFYCSLSLPKPSPPASSLTPDSALFVFIALHGMVSSGVYLFTVCQPNRTKVP